MKKVLIIDDESSVRMILRDGLEEMGYSVEEASGGESAFPMLEIFSPDAVLLDMKMPGMSGEDILRQIKSSRPELPVLILTGYADLKSAVNCIKYGAYDYLEKPPSFEKLDVTLKRALQSSALSKEVSRLEDTVTSSLEWELGESPAMQTLIRQLEQIAQSDFSVVIEGETGTGKSRLARFVHNLSRRAKQPFISVDLGVVPESLVESELFGYERGAFTGAEKKKQGYFELANAGTIFIDEMENISPFVQSKLLSVVEERRFFPLGGTKPIDIDVRVVCATNTNIRSAVQEKRFREDLFFRLGEVILRMPPLRERKEDIPLLVSKFIREASEELHKYVTIEDDVMDVLTAYRWPGNIRELKNVIRRGALFSENGCITRKEIDLLFGGALQEESLEDLPLTSLPEAVQNLERTMITKALEVCGGNKSKATAILKIDYKTLLNKIKAYDLGF